MAAETRALHRRWLGIEELALLLMGLLLLLLGLGLRLRLQINRLPQLIGQSCLSCQLGRTLCNMGRKDQVSVIGFTISGRLRGLGLDRGAGQRVDREGVWVGGAVQLPRIEDIDRIRVGPDQRVLVGLGATAGQQTGQEHRSDEREDPPRLLL